MHSFDIETDTSELTEHERALGFTSRGLVPAITAITRISLCDDPRNPVVFGGDDEAKLLQSFIEAVGAGSGPLVTWNGSVFDIPFIQDRAAILGLPDVRDALEMEHDPDLVPKYDPLPGHLGGYRARIAGREHIDLAYLVKGDAEARGISWSLKPYVKDVLGLSPVEVGRQRMHELSEAELDEYVASDAVVTLLLARHRGLG